MTVHRLELPYSEWVEEQRLARAQNELSSGHPLEGLCPCCLGTGVNHTLLRVRRKDSMAVLRGGPCYLCEFAGTREAAVVRWGFLRMSMGAKEPQHFASICNQLNIHPGVGTQLEALFAAWEERGKKQKQDAIDNLVAEREDLRKQLEQARAARGVPASPNAPTPPVSVWPQPGVNFPVGGASPIEDLSSQMGKTMAQEYVKLLEEAKHTSITGVIGPAGPKVKV